jgi:hypothetical protein
MKSSIKAADVRLCLTTILLLFTGSSLQAQNIKVVKDLQATSNNRGGYCNKRMGYRHTTHQYNYKQRHQRQRHHHRASVKKHLI